MAECRKIQLNHGSLFRCMYFAAAAKISIRDCMHIDSVIMYFIGLSFASVFLLL